MCSLVLIFEARPCLPIFPELRKGLSPAWPPHASSDALDAMNDADANTDADDPGTRYENAPADSNRPKREPRCCGRASACGANIVSRRKLLLQRQPE